MLDCGDAEARRGGDGDRAIHVGPLSIWGRVEVPVLRRGRFGEESPRFGPAALQGQLAAVW